MPDIFISYSRKDSAQALLLAEQLRTCRMDVWMDTHGIEAATSWSKEIVDAVEHCKAFLLLLSNHSVVSKNVMRELSLAFDSERPIVPIELDGVAIPDAYKYQLAGIQRTNIADSDAIVRALTRLGLQAESKVTTLVAPPIAHDVRTSLIVLPFEDLSPSGEDNQWFADGLSGELIDSLGHIKTLRVLDRKTAINLRGTKLRTVEIGKEFDTRYFIEGSVRKYGDQIKISVSLLDIQTGDYLWQESHRGVFNDIFDIQESVAQQVVDGLRLHLTQDEEERVGEHGTSSADAYELYIKAVEYFSRGTKSGCQLAVQLASEAIALDPSYASAYQLKANGLASLYRNYDRNPELLIEAEQLIQEALRIRPNHWSAYNPLTLIFQLQGKLEQAEATAKEYIRNAPGDYGSHFVLGFFYLNTSRFAEAVPAFEEALKLKPDEFAFMWNLVITSHSIDDIEKQTYWANYSLPRFERYLRLHPDNEGKRVEYASLLHFAGRDDDARDAAHSFGSLKDGNSLFNASCLVAGLQDTTGALALFRRSIEAGFRHPKLLKEMFENEAEGLASLKGTAQYEAVGAMLQRIAAEEALTE